MKMKSLLLLALALITIFGMSGCSSNQLGIATNVNTIRSNPEYQQENKNIYLIGTKNDTSNSLSRASDIEESAYFTLQHTAEITLDRGDKYFAIYAPKALSNFQGSTINSMEEFIDKCGSSILGSIGSSFDKYGLNTYYCNTSGVEMVHSAFIEVVFFKERPLNTLVWDAQAVLDYLKDENLYREYDKEDAQTVASWAISGYYIWNRHYRDAK